ncbi:MAG: sugar phosphate isomerase/epimerase [Gemmatimonadetes bacterium]|nr:sugar phosphate isomerase/epimerase [Gemmatimonadota bacterium]MYG15005.1 sugar phosphate isomerase/epimerase [Gemmatimonadota bacterium]MYH19168.1 sugar phosphate isomerase/epimerase [Gemmatimonadota bacterium]MYK98607.1 sugar phosphate isomerase/epimerase [Gemmatimonadota bacterium]
MSVGVCAYSFNTGYDAFQLMDMAVRHGLGGVEFPPDDCLPDLSPASLERARARAEESGLFVVADGGQVEGEMLQRLIPAAAGLGASTLRVVMSGVLGGDRRPLSGRWNAHLAACRDILREALPRAEEHGVTIAVENHSDATSHDMRWLCEELDSAYIGITLDVGNVLAVCEEPFGYTERILPYLRHVHLKDYTIHPSDEGYRIARCSLGSGVVDYPGLLSLIDGYQGQRGPADQPGQITKTIELGAIYARHVRMLMDDYWAEYPDRDIRDLLPFLRLYWSHVRPVGEDWRTPMEKDESTEVLKAYETREFEESVAYLNEIGAVRADSGTS